MNTLITISNIAFWVFVLGIIAEIVLLIVGFTKYKKHHGLLALTASIIMLISTITCSLTSDQLCKRSQTKITTTNYNSYQLVKTGILDSKQVIIDNYRYSESPNTDIQQLTEITTNGNSTDTDYSAQVIKHTIPAETKHKLKSQPNPILASTVDQKDANTSYTIYLIN